jgi:choline dehydrogenase
MRRDSSGDESSIEVRKPDLVTPVLPKPFTTLFIKQQYGDTTFMKTDVGENGSTFDYVIIGAGAAGCVLANRLSEDPQISVCLLEAGPEDRHMFIGMPAGFIKIVGNPQYTWNFPTEPTELTGGRTINIPQGKTLGGGTSINGMAYNRGQRTDFDGWAAAGNRGWSYDDLLPIFKQLECWQGGASSYRGAAGPLAVTRVKWDDPVSRAFIEGAIESGVPRNADFNGASQAGVDFSQVTVNKGRRVSSSSAFLRPARGRRNLEIRTGAMATKILFAGKRATGVCFERGARKSVVNARREVIVSCGAINTPRLLQVSGIGAPDLLAEIGVPVVHALCGVGENFHDHYLVALAARGKNYRSINQLAQGTQLWRQAARWLVGRPSILGLPVAMVHYFLRSGIEPGDADIQGIFTPASRVSEKEGALDDGTGMTCALWQHRPRSRGYVRARSSEINDAPRVQPNYLRDEFDRKVLVAGCRMTRAILHSTPMSTYLEMEVAPGNAVNTDDEWLDFARHSGATVYHPVGTARMGPAGDPTSVVDSTLRVHGIESLRVVDASIMPSITSANTAATTMVIGEKAARMILSGERRMPADLPREIATSVPFKA